MTEESKSKRGRPRTLDADKVLDVAMRAYWRDDPADVSLNAICAMAEVSKPALYRVFGGEDGLAHAVLEKYADEVLSEIFTILNANPPLDEALSALIYFASGDPKMETGCMFFKMRAGKHRLGPKTRALADAIEASAVEAFTAYLSTQLTAEDQPAPLVARFLFEQIGLALSQRAAGEDPAQIKATLSLALSAIARS